MNTDIIHSTILGLLQGITEFLPVSSSGHLIAIPWLMGWEEHGIALDASLHLATFFAIIIYFRRDWLNILREGLLSIKERSIKWSLERRLFWYIIIATLPAVLAGSLAEKSVEAYFRNPLYIALFLGFFALVLYMADSRGRKDKPLGMLTAGKSFLIGILQAAAIIPGVSRSGITASGALFFGFDRESAVKFSFLLTGPVVLAAGIYEMDKIAVLLSTSSWTALTAGFAAAFISSIIAIHFLLKFVRNHSFLIFVIYRLVAAALLLSVFMTISSASILTACASDVDVDVKIYSVKTKDGWTISIDRYIAGGASAKKKAAVILCHGFNINNKFWDLDASCSLAAYLARNGYDVWSPSLRGSGLSSKPLLSDVRNLIRLDLINIPQTLMKVPSDLTKFNWTIDDHIHMDVPAIIEAVKKESGFDKIYWIGHSMGGIAMFGYLETEKEDDIAGFIPIGSMMFIEHPLTPSLQRIADQKPLLTASLLLNTSVAAQFRNFTFGAVKAPIEDLLLRRENMENKIVFRFFRQAIDDTSPGVVAQFSDSIKCGMMVSADGTFSYAEALDAIKVPVLMLVGGANEFVSEISFKKTFDKISSKDKSFTIFSRANGYSADYGHCDLLLGRNSEKEVYPVILNWLDARAGRK